MAYRALLWKIANTYRDSWWKVAVAYRALLLWLQVCRLPANISHHMGLHAKYIYTERERERK